MLSLRLILAALFFSLLCTGYSLHGKGYVLVLSGQVADQSAYNKVKNEIEAIHTLAATLGYDKTKIITAFDTSEPGYLPPRKREILEAIEAVSEQTNPDDQHLLFLLGHAQKTIRATQITTRGPRLNVEDLTSALEPWKGDLVAFAFNRQSSAFLQPLSSRAGIVVSAHNKDNQLNAPVFPKHFLSTWTKMGPDASLINVLKTAGDLTKEHFKQRGLVQAERSQVFDGLNRQAYPFDDISESSPILTAFGNAELLKPSKIAKTDETTAPTPPAKPQRDFPPIKDLFADKPSDKAQPEDDTSAPDPAQEIQAPDEETQQLISLANNLDPQHLQNTATYLRHISEVTIGSNAELEEKTHSQLLIQNPIEVELHQVYRFAQNPSRQFTLHQARVIYPDGSFYQVDPNTSQASFAQRELRVEIPNLSVGSIIELEYSYQNSPDGSLAFFHHEHPVERGYPAASAKLTLSYPKDGGYRHRLYNIDRNPKISESRFNEIYSWDFENLNPDENLPFSLPYTERAKRLVVTDLESWDAFAQVIDRIMDGVDAIDEATQKWVLAYTKDLNGQTEKLKALYDYLANMRYLTKPVGLRGLRPHLPSEVIEHQYADCKDKANALVAFARVLGIQGHFVLLNRMQSTDQTFPSWQFNHALAFFPALEDYPDGLWLDPTDPGTPFASLPPGDFGRVGMVFKEDGFFFRETSLGNGHENELSKKFVLKFQDDALSGDLKISATGLADYEFRTQFRHTSPSTQKAIVQSILNELLPMAHVESFEYREFTFPQPSVKLDIKLKAEQGHYSLSQLQSPLKLWQYFADASREHTTRINDGQPMNITMDVIVNGLKEARNQEPKTWEAENAYFAAKSERAVTPSGIQQSTALKLRNADVESEDYSAVRSQIFEWISKSQIHFN